MELESKREDRFNPAAEAEAHLLEQIIIGSPTDL